MIMTSILRLDLKPDTLAVCNILDTETSQEQERPLIVSPGERSHMTLHLHNPLEETLDVELEVQGNFPEEWCNWNLEGREIDARKTMLVGIYFDVPQDWLETQPLEAIKLNYQARVNIYLQRPNQETRELQQLNFNFYLRPHSLYLDFLPSIYREVDLISRLMKVFEQTFEPTVDAFEAMWAYLDPLTAPEALLPFLAHWVGWELLSTIPIARQRYLIRNAVSIYRWRGTKKGLRFYLHLYTSLPLDEDLPEREKHISIEEAIGDGFILNRANLGEDTVLGGGRPYHFTVRLRSTPAIPLDETLIRQIIEAEKPTWCTYDLYLS
ncbi:MAG: phage tail protein [Xenococcaceae cyanobacterium MO_167.B52]|nr:phage tail protein [Xenococcaceae cyanobacterium MO_167.B52]